MYDRTGRTPPCSQGLVAAKIARVVVGMVDPDPRVSGGGLKTCHDAGMEVVCIGGALCGPGTFLSCPWFVVYPVRTKRGRAVLLRATVCFRRGGARVQGAEQGVH